MKVYEFTYTDRKGAVSTRKVTPLEETESFILGLDLSKLSESQLTSLEEVIPRLPDEEDLKGILKPFNQALRRFLRSNIRNLQQGESSSAPAGEIG